MAPSKNSAALKELFTTISSNFPLSDQDNVWLERALYDQVSTASTEPKSVIYSNTQSVGEVPLLIATPSNASATNGAILFLHGGGFSFGSPGGSHRKLAGHLANACGIQVVSVDYRLTPEHPHPAALDDCIRGYKYLLGALNLCPHQIVICGDSCGGGLASAVPIALSRQGFNKPAATVALSPWYDHTNSGITRKTNADKDAMTSLPFSNKLAARYNADKTPIDDPLISPLFASKDEIKEAMPPHWISVAGDDTLRCDGEEMAKKLQEAGVEARLEVGEGMQHVFEFMAGKAPEADESLENIGRWVREKLSTTEFRKHMKAFDKPSG